MSKRIDIGSANPRMQCAECGRWKRLHGIIDGKHVQRFMGGCEVTHNEHPCGGDVCTDCCPSKCRARIAKEEAA